MSTLRKRKPQDPPELNNTPKQREEIIDNGHQQTPKLSPYERSREERIKENLERMQKLGLMDLSLKLQASTTPPKRTTRTNPSSTKLSSPFLPSGPLRRSSRLQNSTPVSYSEAALAKKDVLLEDEDLTIGVGSKPEIYTEEHEKLLGSTERSWTLFVNGYGNDGKRIYDQINGKTCHQCRQKTLGYRTHCSICKMVQGQFCGDCLYMRYGEHVLEALENPNWICPVCRGICNCSLCRQAKGWRATGTLYRRISSLGYKSVAHYLIQTRPSQSTATEVSAKRSLPFSNTEAVSEEPQQVTNDQNQKLKHQPEEKMLDEFKSKKDNAISNSGNPAKNVQSPQVCHEVHHCLSKPQSQDEINGELKKEKLTQSNGYLATACQADRLSTFPSCEARSADVEFAVEHEVHHDKLGLSNPKFEDKSEFEVEKKEELYSIDKEDTAEDIGR